MTLFATFPACRINEPALSCYIDGWVSRIGSIPAGGMSGTESPVASAGSSCGDCAPLLLVHAVHWHCYPPLPCFVPSLEHP